MGPGEMQLDSRFVPTNLRFLIQAAPMRSPRVRMWEGECRSTRQPPDSRSDEIADQSFTTEDSRLKLLCTRLSPGRAT